MAQGRVSALMLAPLSPTEDVDFVWPSAAEVRATQDQYVNSLAATDSAEAQHLVQLNTDGFYRTSEGESGYQQNALISSCAFVLLAILA
jgi:hypothetical protein